MRSSAVTNKCEKPFSESEFEVVPIKLHYDLSKISQSGSDNSTRTCANASNPNTLLLSGTGITVLSPSPSSLLFLLWNGETLNLVYQLPASLDLKKEKKKRPTISLTAAAEPQLRGGLQTITASNHPSTDTTWGNWMVPPIFCLERSW